MTVQEAKQAMQSEWVSIAPEIRPSTLKNSDGSIKPFYLTRAFKDGPDERFELTILNLADPYGNLPLAKLYIKGHMIWQGDHPIAAGAKTVNFIADEDYEVTPLLQGFADAINQVAGKAYAIWKVNRTQSIFQKGICTVRACGGANFREVRSGLSPKRSAVLRGETCRWPWFRQRRKRPTNLQIPLVRKQS